MIQIIAEHADATITARTTINDNLIVTEDFDELIDALSQLDRLIRDFEGLSLWGSDFTVTHEWEDLVPNATQ